MDMLNTMVAMSLGAEAVGVHLVPSGKAETEGRSFAKSFDEGVLAVDAEAAMATDKRAAALPDFKNGVPVTIPDVLVAMTDQAKAKATVAKVATSEVGDGESVVVAKSVSVGKRVDATATGSGNLRAMPTFGKVMNEAGRIWTTDAGISVGVANVGLDGAQAKTVADAVGPVQSESFDGRVDVAAGDVSSARNGVPTVEVKDASPMQPVSVAQPDRPVVLSRDEDHAAKQEIEGTGAVKLELPSPVKKTTKGHEGTAGVKIAHKAAGAAENVAVVVAKALAVTDTQTAVVPVSGVAAPVVTQQNQTAKELKSGPSAVVPDVMERSAGVVSATNGKGGKENVRLGKVSVVNDKPEVAAADDSGGSSQSVSGFAKAAALATSPTSDGEGKMQGANTGLVHASAGAVPGLVVGVASTHVVSEMTSAKLQSGGLGGHAATLPAASGEMNGPGVLAAPSIDGTHRTLMVTPTALEVGIANGTHGWLKIRAEMTGSGVVNASLSTASPAGQEMLHRELTSLTAYLQQEQVAVNAVVVHAPVAGTEAQGLAGGSGGDASGQAQQRHGQGGEGRQEAGSTGLNYTDETAYDGLNGVGVDGLLLPATYAGGGNWLSVRA